MALQGLTATTDGLPDGAGSALRAVRRADAEVVRLPRAARAIGSPALIEIVDEEERLRAACLTSPRWLPVV